ncbi:MAG TPA: type II secretion system protein [Humisphaera sp.]
MPVSDVRPRPVVRPAARRGFTLVELLVVIGIIALLMSILLPTLGRVKEQANKIKCGSNLRQLGMAFTSYTQRNQGYYPRPAAETQPEDWIYWESTRNINDSPIAPYLSGAANEEALTAALQCPTDDLFQRPLAGRYKYSYTVNFYMCRLNRHGKTLNTSQVRSPSNKILAIEENNQTLDDGCWAWQQDQGRNVNLLSRRHDKQNENVDDKLIGRGNAAFCDGHVEYISREDSFKPTFWHPTATVDNPPPPASTLLN